MTAIVGVVERLRGDGPVTAIVGVVERLRGVWTAMALSKLVWVHSAAETDLMRHKHALRVRAGLVRFT